MAMPMGGKPEVAATVMIQMDQGTCRVSLKHGTELTVLFGTGEGYWRGRIPTGSELVLDPQGNAGNYELTVGPKWHLLSPVASIAAPAEQEEQRACAFPAALVADPDAVEGEALALEDGGGSATGPGP